MSFIRHCDAKVTRQIRTGWDNQSSAARAIARHATALSADIVQSTRWVHAEAGTSFLETSTGLTFRGADIPSMWPATETASRSLRERRLPGHIRKNHDVSQNPT
jgi:hypothetical protein